MIFELSNSKEKKVTPTFYVDAIGDLQIKLNEIPVLVIQKTGRVVRLLISCDNLENPGFDKANLKESAAFPGQFKLKIE